MQPTVPLGTTALSVSPLCLGGNVFGWTADEDASFAVLDAYAAAGGNFIDTADAYGAGSRETARGESETIIGRWMAARGNRDDLVIATKVGRPAGIAGSARPRSAPAPRRRCGGCATDRIDLYYAHADDPETPLDETLGAFDALVREGKVRHIAASNYTAPRLAEALEVSDAAAGSRGTSRSSRTTTSSAATSTRASSSSCASREDVACVPYFAPGVSGFLTGKYRPGGTEVESPRAESASKLPRRARAARCSRRSTRSPPPTRRRSPAVALAWLRAQPAVTAPIASARSPEQLAELLPMAELELRPDELDRLTSAHGEA